MTNGEAKRRLKLTQFLQFQLSQVNDTVDKLKCEIFTMADAGVSGAKLNQLKEKLAHHEGRLETLKMVFDYRNKMEV